MVLSLSVSGLQTIGILVAHLSIHDNLTATLLSGMLRSGGGLEATSGADEGAMVSGRG